jgi:DNA mismatch repair protein PMS2
MKSCFDSTYVLIPALLQRGTTVIISDLFATLPVRRRELLKNIKREFAKAQALLQAYAIISRGVRWVVTNTVKGRKTSIMTITGSNVDSYIRSNTSSVFGSKACTTLIPLELNIPMNQSRSRSLHKTIRSLTDEDGNDMEETSIKVEGLISRPTHGSGRSASDRIFLYLNGRPWDSSRIVRAFNEVYKSFNSNQYPLVVANFSIGGDRYDVNVSPDKRTLFLHDENEIIDGLKVRAFLSRKFIFTALKLFCFRYTRLLWKILSILSFRLSQSTELI